MFQPMRGTDTQQSSMFSYLSPEDRVPANHPLRPIRLMVDDALTHLLHHAGGSGPFPRGCNFENGL